MNDFHTLSCLKVGEGGGVSQRQAMNLLRSAGIEAKKGYSPYVGHYGIEVPAGRRRSAERLIWSSTNRRNAVYKRRASQ